MVFGVGVVVAIGVLWSFSESRVEGWSASEDAIWKSLSFLPVLSNL